MKVLVIGHLTGKDIGPHLQAEGRRVAELRNRSAGCWHALDTLAATTACAPTWPASATTASRPSTPPLPDAPGYQSRSAPDANQVNGHG
jgi:hypothetical protein